MQAVRSVVRVLAVLSAVFLAGPGLVLATPAARAATAAAAARAAVSPSLAISITGITPQYATSGSTVNVTGTLANHTGSATTGITVQAYSTAQNFSSRSDMTSFADDDRYAGQLQQAGSSEVTGTVRSGATIRWSVSYPASSFYDTFGVFPVRVQASTADGAHTADARTFLVYWTSSTPVTPLKTGWVWPLADSPQQGACAPTLTTNELAGSVSAGGRLSALLNAGASYAQTDDLTWDIDPALLSDVSVMRNQYHTETSDTSAACTGRLVQPGSPDAATWLIKLAADTAGQPAFLTSYGNSDAAALSHAGLDPNLRSAYDLGEKVAGQILPGTFGRTGSGTSDGSALRAAWPTGGKADAEVLTSLASDGGISTVLLSSDELSSPVTEYDNALGGRTTSGIGTSMSVLLADSGITSLLGSASSRATAAGQFSLTQSYLAQTAMIASEAPTLARSLVVAPPAYWNPSAAEATALLKITRDAPWLKPAGLSGLAQASAKVKAAHIKARQVSHSELPASYLDQLKLVDGSATVFTDLLYKPSDKVVSSLQEAVAATASSAWRGSDGQAMSQLTAYLKYSEHQVKIISGTKVLLAGTSGDTPVSVKNGLHHAITVLVRATTPAGSQLRVSSQATPLTVQAEKTNTVRMHVSSAAIGTTTVQLQLVTQDGSPLTWTKETLSVEVTRVGRSLLIIIGGALAILVLTSVFRLRRKRQARARQRGTAPDTADAGGAG
jgi:hypothetical protein